MLLAFLSYPVGALVRRLRGRRGPTPARRPARSLALLGPATVLITIGYLFMVVATGATGTDGTVLARPPAWLCLQLCAVTVVVAAVITAVRWRSMAQVIGRTRPALLLAGAAIFVPWAGYSGRFTT